MKIAFLASCGGHFEELCCLKPLAQKHDAFVVTERAGPKEDALAPWARQVYQVRQINRHAPFFAIRFAGLCARSLGIFIKERPDCVISTGALATYPFCLLAKLLRKKVVYIESFARVDSPSLTGRLMVRLADLFIVQWQEMLRFYPRAQYIGGIF